MDSTKFSQIVKEIEAPGDRSGETDGPDRIARALTELGLLPEASSVILIAGTNG
jgi:folylpolyglutamate synthase/dihydropteroate synthase